MISDNPSVKFELISQMVAQENNQMTVTELCAIAHVSRSGYYRWIDAAPKRAEREKADQADFELILWAYQKRGYSKGARGIYMCLLHRNPMVIMNLKKIHRLMNKYSLMCPIRKANPYRRMAKALKTSNVAQYLLDRKFREFGPRMVLLTDITYIPYNSTFAYLSTILDAFTKQILSYVLSDSLEVDFVLETVNQLIEKHGVSLKAETLINSDQGCHYTSYSFIQLIKDKGLRQSMSHRGICWDNAPQLYASFFYTHIYGEVQ
jgi:transposase InsO family protein